MKLIRLAGDDFDLLAAETEMGPDARMMAKGVLVDRRTLTEMAAEYDVSKQRVHLAVETIRKEYAKSKQHNGWLGLELELPHELATNLERFAAALTSQSDAALREGALVKLARAIASAEHTLQS